MTYSIKEQVLQQVITTLAGTTGVSTRIYRNRPEPLQRDETPALVVEAGNAVALTNTIAYTDWGMAFMVNIVYMGSATPETDIDEIQNSVHSKLMADRTLNGLAHDILPVSFVPNTQEGDFPVYVLRMEYRISFRTNIGDLTTSET